MRESRNESKLRALTGKWSLQNILRGEKRPAHRALRTPDRPNQCIWRKLIIISCTKYSSNKFLILI